MPHIVIEYSKNIENQSNINSIISAVVNAACSSGEISRVDIKARAIPFDLFQLGSRENTFIHVTLSLLEGRTDDQKVAISKDLRKTLDEYLPTVSSISIDIRDMNATAYKKRLL
tara:strand:- start:777 stop:1118 length:342 start_codon:yes stop_codon:yes gene_type:complete